MENKIRDKNGEKKTKKKNNKVLVGTWKLELQFEAN